MTRNIFFLLLFPFFLHAQDTLPVKRKPGGFEWNKVYTGGNIGLQFGSYTFVDVSPIIGYRFTEKFTAGVGATYKYLSIKDYYGTFSTNIYGGSVFSRYFFFPNLFGHLEYEVLNREVYDIKDRINVVSVLGGAGYRQALGSSSYIELLVLWNFNESAYSLYSNPIIRGGFNIGF